MTVELLAVLTVAPTLEANTRARAVEVIFMVSNGNRQVQSSTSMERMN